MPSLIGTDVAANYLRVLPSPGAALTGVANGAPLMTFNTPNLQMFKVEVTGKNLTSTPEAADSSWSKTVRGLQVTSELFAVFAPANTANGAGEADDVSVFCFLAPDFNTNTGAVASAADTGKVQPAIAQSGGNSSIVETAIADALGLAASAVVVTRVALTGVAVA
jgi:hypothetical protein